MIQVGSMMIDENKLARWSINAREVKWSYKRYFNCIRPMLFTAFWPSGIDIFEYEVFNAVHGKEIDWLIKKAWQHAKWQHDTD